ncbi:MAG: HEAT repeat domain-containing protein [Planctomycetales bacterium]|nr:HEAT repeat domain-containing protein [Planctomycetales bacterium]
MIVLLGKRITAAPRHVWGSLATLLMCVALPGCRFGDTRAEPGLHVEQQAATENLAPNVPPALAANEWVLRVGPSDNAAALPRWRHPGLEKLIDLPADQRPGLVALLESDSPVAKANAAIALARLNQGEPGLVVGALAEAVSSPMETLPAARRMSLRQAAAEALGAVESSEALTAINQLLAELGDLDGANRSKYESKLHAELIHALNDAGADLPVEQGLAALRSPDREVRLQAIRAWPIDLESPLPPEVVQLAQDPDDPIRSAVLRLLAASQHPKALNVCQQSLADHDIAVRLTAIEGLALLGGNDAAKILRGLLAETQGQQIRSAVVRALDQADEKQAAFSAVGDEAWQVRQAVAECLADKPGESAKTVARQLLGDTSTQVAESLVSSLSTWPLSDSAPLLLDAMASEQFATRKAATETLADRWPAARQFSYQASADVRAEVLNRLRQQWEESAQPVGDVTPASAIAVDRHQTPGAPEEADYYLKMLASTHPSNELRARYRASLLAMGESLLPAVDDFARRHEGEVPDDVLTKVLPEIDASFAELLRMRSPHLADRRAAAAALAKRVSSGTMSALALRQLGELIVREDDPLVWRAIQEPLQVEEDESVVFLQTAGLTHPAADIRRRACEYFAMHPTVAPTDALLASLDDDDTSVVVAALTAIGLSKECDNPAPIVRLTASRDKMVRVAAAMTLSQLGHSDGADALERLALDDDVRIRRIAAESMGHTQLERFVPILIRLLDDQLSVRRAALASLVEIVGDDIGRGDGPAEPNTDEQIHRWRKWHLLRNVN